MKLPDLPITDILPDIVSALSTHHEAVLEAPPGAGKTTLVPLALLDQPWRANGKILMLEPRRMAARAAAQRMASLLGEPVGKTVGYRVRQDTRISADTVIEVITGGILTRWLQEDPSLEGVSLVIFDEFHERHLDSDLGLALCLQGRNLFREAEPLKLLIMSATLNGEAVAELLGGAPLVRSEGRMYPVDVRYGRTRKLSDPVAPAVATTLLQALQEEPGSVLVFLPGVGELHQVMRELEGRLPANVDLMPLHGNLSLDEQQRAIAPPCPPSDSPGATGERPPRKVVLATNIAESSLTIEGVRIVIDAGLTREPAFDPNSGMTRLITRRVSQASSVQRCGRAGRLEPGCCYRLWSQEQQHQLAPYATPEVLQADLAPLALQLLAWGIDDPRELQWLNAPPTAAFQQALDLLARLGAAKQQANGSWLLTEHGERMNAFPAHPRIAHLLLNAAACNAVSQGTALAAVLSETFRTDGSADVRFPLSLVTHLTSCPARHKNWLHRTRRQADIFRQLLSNSAPPQNKLDEEDIPGYLLACAYPDRIAKQRAGQHGVYQLSNGRSAKLPEGDPLANNTWLVCAEVGGLAGVREDRIGLAAPFNPALLDSALSSLVTHQNILEWDKQTDRFVAERRLHIGAIIVRREPVEQPSQEEKLGAVLNFVRQRGLQLLPWTDALRQWQARVLLLRAVTNDPDNPWPDVSDQGLLNSIDQWLAPYLTRIDRLADFQQLDLHNILQALLPWPLPQQLDALAPREIAVPSGSRIPLDYSQSPPVLAVKLQEMFGCETTPTIANGKVQITLHLLSPARRPLQITQDLAGFWRTSYTEVKKEMKGRYPKHPWPDDPLKALPTRHVKARQQQ